MITIDSNEGTLFYKCTKKVMLPGNRSICPKPSISTRMVADFSIALKTQVRLKIDDSSGYGC